jgi:hypothetical protein
MACTSFTDAITALIRNRGAAAPLERAEIESWLAEFGREASRQAEELGISVRDLACTLVAAVVTPAWSAFCQVGDGGMVVNGSAGDDNSGAGPKFELVFWPELAQYANETYFITATDAADHLQFRVHRCRVREIVLFSDGLQRLVLNFETREAFIPFFDRMLEPVRKTTERAGEVEELSRQLASYLGSATITERTDDDVSLILATCEEPTNPAPTSGPRSDASAREGDAEA